jgi:hypothetical protein
MQIALQQSECYKLKHNPFNFKTILSQTKVKKLKN